MPKRSIRRCDASHVPDAVQRVTLLRRAGTHAVAKHGPRICSAPLARCAASGECISICVEILPQNDIVPHLLTELVSMTKLDLSAHVALVTGGSRGIGAAIALALAELGAAVAVNYRERADDAESVVAKIKANGGRAIAVAADVSQSAAVTPMVEHVARDLGPIDILVNNAGIAIVRGVDDLTETDFDRTILVNLKSAFLCTQAVLPAMRARQWGRIVNISSGAARGAGAIGPHYNASKAGMEGLTRGYAARLVKEGITVNNVAPSLIATDMMGGRTALARNIPLGRMGQAEEVAQAVAMVLGNSYMTGQTIVLNGGMAFI